MTFLLLIAADFIIAVQYLFVQRNRLKLGKYAAVIVMILCVTAGFFWNQERNLGQFLFASVVLAAPFVVLGLRIADPEERRNHIRPLSCLLSVVQLVLGIPSLICVFGLWDILLNGWS